MSDTLFVVVLLLSCFAVAVFVIRLHFQRRHRKSRLTQTMGSGAAWLPQIRHRVEEGRLVLVPSLKIGSFIGMLIVALFWNGLLSIFVLAVFTTGALTGFMTAFMIPFILIGLFLIGLALKQFLAMFNPRVELTINQAQSSPGDTLHISWQINGSLDRLKKLRILLAGEEVAVYRRGTNMVTDRHEFQNIQVYESDAISGIGAAKVEIPRDAMHSFRARSNSIVWKLRVRGEVPRWPDIEADYEILVVPPGVTRG